jgi:hypothetical protein
MWGRVGMVPRAAAWPADGAHTSQIPSTVRGGLLMTLGLKSQGSSVKPSTGDLCDVCTIYDIQPVRLVRTFQAHMAYTVTFGT